MSKNKNWGGTYIETDNEGKTWGERPSVGQSKPYKSGDNSHGRSEKARGGNTTAHHDGGSSSTQEHMIPSKSSKG